MINHRLIPLNIIMALLLSSCAVSNETKKVPTDLGDRLVNKGKKYLNNDEYINAMERFNQALMSYQGLDHREGIAYCHINLVDVFISLGNLDKAREHLIILHSMWGEKEIGHLKDRITMLEVRLDYIDGNYDDSLKKLKPLLPEFDQEGGLRQKADLQLINILAARTLLSFKSHIEQSILWTDRYKSALNAYGKDSPSHAALLLRFNANIMVFKKKYTEAELLLNNALATYKDLGNRRSIAATLRELGKLKMEEQQWEEADKLLQRALSIRLLISDHLGASIILKDLISMHRSTGQKDQEERYSEMLIRLDGQVK